MRLVLAAGTTRTASIDGISAAGADPDAMLHTPAADAEILAYGRPVGAPAVPVSPTGCPTPGLVTRAVRELDGFELAVIDAGLAVQTGAPTIAVGAAPGEDLREPEPVPAAESVFRKAEALAAELPDDELLVGESVPGGTTTALGVLRALGEPAPVSSSLPENPRELKASVVRQGLAASELDPGAAAGDPFRALRTMGDPVLAAVAGAVVGAAGTGTEVTLAGGTQLLAAGALARHAGVDAPLTLATTVFIDDDVGEDLRRSADRLDLEVVVTDPRFDRSDHPALTAFVDGEAKEGVGMGGALHVADRAGISMRTVRERVLELYQREVGPDGP